MRHLRDGVGHAPGNGGGIVLTPGAQPFLQRLPRRRQDEDRTASRHQFSNLPGALPVDLEDHVLATRQGGFDRAPRRAVLVVEHPGMLQEFAVIHHPPEHLAVDEKVVPAMLFARPLGAGGMRYRNRQARTLLAQGFDETGLAGARGRRDDEERA